jgi:hypothetical protein
MGEIFLRWLVRSPPRFRISTVGGRRGGRRPAATAAHPSAAGLPVRNPLAHATPGEAIAYGRYPRRAPLGQKGNTFVFLSGESRDDAGRFLS